VVKLYVEIDTSKGLFESLDIKWCNQTYHQSLDYIGIPFRCAKCHRTGHLMRNCKGNWVDSSSESLEDHSTGYMEEEDYEGGGGFCASPGGSDSPTNPGDELLGKLFTCDPALFKVLLLLLKGTI